MAAGRITCGKLLYKPEVFVNFAEKKFHADGKCIDEKELEVVSPLLKALVDLDQ